RLPLGPDYGGPLFFAHYSFLTLDPRGLEDRYANYWDQNLSHTLINREYCIRNPRGHRGYSANCWGLSASDNPAGYSAHSPTNDHGVITPTAALSSFPYTPDHSMSALRHFYGVLGDRLWGRCGFVDAFSADADWYAKTYLAIDQGPIVAMIENHRSAALWKLFMSAPEIRSGLGALGFTSPQLSAC
ncbi:MAG: glucoamylase family protein, partial [Gammaproteobacteria bacterium]